MVKIILSSITRRASGIIYTIKDGIIYDAKALLSDVRKLVAQKKLEIPAKNKTKDSH